MKLNQSIIIIITIIRAWHYFNYELITSLFRHRSPMTFTMSLNILGKQCVFSRRPWTSMQSNLRTTRSPSHLSISLYFSSIPYVPLFLCRVYIYRYERGDGPRIQRDRKQIVTDALDAWEHTNWYPGSPF